MARALDGRSALVTGGSRGIGEAIARRFAAEGADLAICSRSADAIGDVAAEIEAAHDRQVVPITCDVGDPDAIDRMIERTTDSLGPIDVLVNNAGGSIPEADGGIGEVDDETLDWSIDVNLKGQFRVARGVLPSMTDAGGGSMIHIGSVNGMTGIGLTAYSSAKSGIRALSKNIAVDYGHRGIRSNVIAPGTIETERRVREAQDTAERSSRSEDTVRETWLDQYPLGRFGTPDEVADAALFLASNRSSFVTGTELVVDGGLTAGLGQQFQRTVYNIEADTDSR